MRFFGIVIALVATLSVTPSTASGPARAGDVCLLDDRYQRLLGAASGLQGRRNVRASP